MNELKKKYEKPSLEMLDFCLCDTLVASIDASSIMEFDASGNLVVGGVAEQ